MKLKNIIKSSLIATLLLSGCATTELQTKVKMTRSVWLKPTNQEKKSVYVQLKNVSEEKLNIMPLLKQRLKAKGYILTQNPEDANYVLMINILFANNLKEAHAIKAAVGAGATSSIVAAGSGSNTGASLLIGAAFALAAGTIGKATEDETYRAVVDVLIDEKTDDPAFKGTMGNGYKEQHTRVLAQAVKTELKLDEALPILEKEVAKQISNIF